jgi:hypothetical protein
MDLGMMLFLFLLSLGYASARHSVPPPIEKLLVCPKGTLEKKSGQCCLKGTEELFKNGKIKRCTYHGPHLYGLLSDPTYTVTMFEEGIDEGPHYHFVNGKIRLVEDLRRRGKLAQKTYFDELGRVYETGYVKDSEWLTGKWKKFAYLDKRTLVLNFVDRSPDEIVIFSVCNLKGEKCKSWPVLDRISYMAQKVEKPTGILGAFDIDRNLGKRSNSRVRSGTQGEVKLTWNGLPMGIVIGGGFLVAPWSGQARANIRLDVYLVSEFKNGYCRVNIATKYHKWNWVSCEKKDIKGIKSLELGDSSGFRPVHSASAQNAAGPRRGESVREHSKIFDELDLSVRDVEFFKQGKLWWVKGETYDPFSSVRDLEKDQPHQSVPVHNYIGKPVMFPLLYKGEVNLRVDSISGL